MKLENFFLIPITVLLFADQPKKCLVFQVTTAPLVFVLRDLSRP